MVTDILETAVVDMVVAAGLEIQVPPLRGGGTMDDDQCYLAHTGRLNTTLYTYDAAIAVATAMITFRMVLQVDFLF